jgi:hypothetical protein
VRDDVKASVLAVAGDEVHAASTDLDRRNAHSSVVERFDEILHRFVDILDHLSFSLAR